MDFKTVIARAAASRTSDVHLTVGLPPVFRIDGKLTNDGTVPLTEAEIASLGVEKKEVLVDYEIGQSVRITDGALESFLGTVEEIDLDRGKVRVVVSMFGRETPVELELDQVEPNA